jgi:hypothetical protein
MARLDLLQKDHWRHFLDLPGLYDMSMPALLAADSFFEYLVARAIPAPSPSDYADWALSLGREAAPAALKNLQTAFAVCFPGHTLPIAEVHAVLQASAPALPVRSGGRLDGGPGHRSHHVSTLDWDPIAPPARRAPFARHVSVPPQELPDEWQAILRRAATGMPVNEVAVAQSIVRRIREKLCQLALSAQRAGCRPSLDHVVVERYFADLRMRLRDRKHGLRWATLRATAEELYRFSRMLDEAEENRKWLSRLLGECTSRERFQSALKHFKILESGHTTDTLLDLAESLLATASSLTSPLKRHRTRNAACILGLFAIAPLRNASAGLVFGKTLFWRNGQWVIETRIQKTAQYSARDFVMPLEPETGRFIDAVVVGDGSLLRLPELRKQVQDAERPLFILPDGSPAAPSYIPRVFKAVTGISFTSTRSLLHTDEAIHNREVGVQNALVACHQKPGGRIEEKYQLEAVVIHAVDRLRASNAVRRRDALARLGHSGSEKR